jgi:hypothetical protein
VVYRTFLFLFFTLPTHLSWAQNHGDPTPEAITEIGKIKDCNNFDLAQIPMPNLVNDAKNGRGINLQFVLILT